MFNMFNII